MPVGVQKRGSQYCVVEPGGKVRKCYKTKAEALAYQRAINANLHHREARNRLRRAGY